MKTSQEFISKKQFRKLCEYAIHYQFCYCYLCGKPILEGQHWNLDHIIPRSKKGQTTPENLRPVHYDCNTAKADLSLGQYRQIQQIILKKGRKR
jgi:5-methylcytosine-specific restriction endonuclease McrA